MLRTDALLGDFETLSSVLRRSDGELLRLSGKGRPTTLAFLPDAEDRVAREMETVELVAYPGIPRCRPTTTPNTGATALILEGVADARPLCMIHDFPEPTLRAGLVSLLAALRFAHSRGIVHRRIDRSMVLADASGQFWLTGWSDAKPVPDGPPVTGVLSPVARDLHDLARAFSEALLRRPWPDPDSASVHVRGPRTAAGQELLDAGVKLDRDTARVLSRLVTSDPRDAYTGATDVLADLGATALTAFDPWESVRLIGFRREVVRAVRYLAATRLPSSETVTHVSSVDFVGPSGSGKSRLLAEVARAARTQDAIVLTAEGGAAGSWGGLGVLCRQLVQLLGRGARTCVQHEDVIRMLLGESDGSARREPQGPIPGSDPLLSLCTAAITDLVRIAFRHTPGMLILDDEEHLPPVAREVWRAVGRFTQAVNGGGGVLRALLVTASTTAYPTEVGSDRVVVELRPWRQRELDKFLARAFASPAGARDASVAIYRTTGGRPGDVVSYLRDLERAGGLRREGLRWRLDTALAALPPLAPDSHDRIRRRVEAAGRDAAALTECLAVGHDVRLPRGAVAEMAGLSGPTLASAADAAVAAGLLVADGASWRVRTGAVAHKVRAGLPAERAKALHREVLHHLLDHVPDAIHAIATHARAGSDPRADAWTRTALTRAQSDSDWLLALDHLDDAAIRLGGWFQSVEALILRASLAQPAGLLVSALETLDRVIHDCNPGRDELLAAVILRARVNYEAREWGAVLAFAVPERHDAGVALAELRFIRAAALRHRSRFDESAREARIAAAELTGHPPARVEGARLEYEYQCAIYAHDFVRARRAILAAMRLQPPSEHALEHIALLAKYANLLRAGPEPHLGPVTSRLVYLTRMSRGVGQALKSRVWFVLGHAAGEVGAARRGVRHLARALFHAEQTGMPTLIKAARIALTLRRLTARGASYEDRKYIESIAMNVSSEPLDALASCSFELSYCLAYYGLQGPLERLWSRVSTELEAGPRFETVRGMTIVGRLWLGECPEDLLPLSSSSGERFARLSAALDDDDMGACAHAYACTMPAWRPCEWSEGEGLQGLVDLATRPSNTGWGAAYLALVLILWTSPRISREAVDRLRDQLRRHTAPLPLALEWQRCLFESLESMRVNDLRNGSLQRVAAVRQLDLLADPIYGTRGVAARDRWMRELEPQAPPTGLGSLHGVREEESYRATHQHSAVSALVASWYRPLVRSAERSGLNLILARHGEELRRIANVVFPRHSQIRDCAGLESLLAAQGEHYPYRIIVARLERWTSAAMASLVRSVARLRNDSTRIVGTSTASESTISALSASHRSMLELLAANSIVLPPILADAARRRAYLDAMLADWSDASLDDRVVQRLVQHDWPGGISELERVLAAARDAGDGAIDLESLTRIGFEGSSRARGCGTVTIDQLICDAIGTAGRVSATELVALLKVPRRTLQRRLGDMVRSGTLLRHGRARASSYSSNSERAGPLAPTARLD